MNNEEFYKLSVKKKKKFIIENINSFEDENKELAINNKKFKFRHLAMAKKAKDYKKYFNYNNEVQASLIENKNLTLLDKISLINSEDYGVSSRAFCCFFNQIKFSNELIEDFCIRNPSVTNFYFLIYCGSLSDNFFNKLLEIIRNEKSPGAFGIEYKFKNEIVRHLHHFDQETIYKIFNIFPDMVNLFVSRYESRFNTKIKLDYIYDNLDKFYYVHKKLNLSKDNNFYILLKKIEWSIFL